MSTVQDLRQRRRERLRYRLRQKGGGRPRLSVFRSGKHIYAQVIDDAQGRTLAAASSLEKEMRERLSTGADKEAAAAVGRLVAERAVAAGAKLMRAVENQFYGDRLGTVEDPFGHVWHLATHVEDLSPREMKKRAAKMAGKAGAQS